MLPIHLAHQKLGGSAQACKGANSLTKLLLLLLKIPFSILDKLLMPYLKADYILSCSPALMSARQTINSLKTSLQAQQTIADRYEHAFQHARLLTMQKGVSFGTLDSIGAKTNSYKIAQKIVLEDAYNAAS